MPTTWIVVIAAVAVLFLLNGTLSYIFRARQMRSKGKEPPSYLRYMFFPGSFSDRVPMPRSVRWPLGVVVLLGGTLFLLLGVTLTLLVDPSSLAHPSLIVVPLLVFGPLGAGIGYVGWRMLRMKSEDEPLLGITKRWRGNPTDTAK
jgi:hypothetical protein